MERFDWRTIGIALLMPVAVFVGTVGLRFLPKHGGWYLAAVLLVLGAVFGLRAIILVIAACIAWFVVARTQCGSAEECSEVAVILVPIMPIGSIPAVAGAIIGALIRRFAFRSATSSYPS